MVDFYIKRGDTLPVLRMALTDADGAMNLTNVTAAKLLARSPAGLVLTRDFEIDTPPTAGTITYEFVAADWEAAGFTTGFWTTEVELTFVDGTVLTVPTVGQRTMQIESDLG